MHIFSFLPLMILLAIIFGICFAMNKDSESSNTCGYMKVSKLILLFILTLGIYGFFWIYNVTVFLNQKMLDEEKAAWKSVVLCIFVPFYTAYWAYKESKKLNEYIKTMGNTSNDLSIISLILSLCGFFIVAAALMQDQINGNLQYIPEKQRRHTEIHKDKYESKTTYAEKKNGETYFSDEEVYDKLKKLKELLDLEILTTEEFEERKKQLLSKM